MKNTKIKNIFPKLILFPLLSIAISVNAFQTVPSQSTVNDNSNRTSKNGSMNSGVGINSNAVETKKASSADDDRVIKQITTELVDDDSCVECSSPVVLQSFGFPGYALFAIGGGALLTPLLFNNTGNPTGPTADVSNSLP